MLSRFPTFKTGAAFCCVHSVFTTWAQKTLPRNSYGSSERRAPDCARTLEDFQKGCTCPPKKAKQTEENMSRGAPGGDGRRLLSQRLICSASGLTAIHGQIAASPHVRADQLGVFLAQEIASLSRGLRVDVRLINHNSDRALTSCYIKTLRLPPVCWWTDCQLFFFLFFYAKLCRFLKTFSSYFVFWSFFQPTSKSLCEVLKLG